MTLSTSTDETQTIKRKIELTTGTSLRYLMGPVDEPKDSVSTELPMMVLVDPTIECSTVKTCSGFPYQEYIVDDEETTFGVWDRLRLRAFRSAEPYSMGNQGFGNYAEQSIDEPCSGNSIFGYAFGSLLRESADRIFTNGTTCTLIRHKVFNCAWGAQFHKDIKAVSVLFLNCEPVVGLGCSALTSVASDVEEFSQKQLERRERLRAAYQAGMKALQLAEEAHLQAVREESKLGIDWDEWEDPPVDL